MTDFTDGRSAIHVAASADNIDMVELLVQNRVSYVLILYEVDNDSGWNGQFALVYQADLSLVDKHGSSPVHVASKASSQCLKVCYSLVSQLATLS